jgi:hypothetical protein
MSLKDIVKKIPEGFSKTRYNSRTFSVTKTTFNSGKSYKLFAEELGGSDFISANIYVLGNAYTLKPCEMPIKKVLHFLNHKQDF